MGERRIGRQVLERQHCDDRTLGAAPVAAVSGCVTVFGHLVDVVRIGDEPVPLTVDRPDDRLFTPTVTDRLAQRLDLGGERRLADEAVAPHPVEQVVLGHQLAAPIEQLDQDLHRPRFQRDHLAIASQLPPVAIEFAASEDHHPHGDQPYAVAKIPHHMDPYGALGLAEPGVATMSNWRPEMTTDDKVVVGLTHADDEPENVLIAYSTWVATAEVKGAPSVYEFTAGGALVVNC
jgi:hypothetical protein